MIEPKLHQEVIAILSGGQEVNKDVKIQALELLAFERWIYSAMRVGYPSLYNDPKISGVIFS